MALPAGKQRLGDYLIGETIGKGSFGKVKRGHHIPTNELVAIKILNRSKLKNANMDKKISREIKILKLFSHPNICRLYQVLATPTDIFLIMEHVDGGELYDHIVKKGRLTEDAARYIFQQIVCALEYCHHFRVVHRDLKPENILLGPGLQVKLIDFGLSNLMNDGEFLASSCGSPNYAAPEVISGKLYYGPEVDVWSCGVIMYALLCGCLPFDEETIPQLFAIIKKGVYTIPDHVRPDARVLLEQILVTDPLSRLTIPQIRDSAWFNARLPFHLMHNESSFVSTETRISPPLVRQVSELLQVTDRVVRSEIERGEGPFWVAYNILQDTERQKQISTFTQSLHISDSGSPNPLGAPASPGVRGCIASPTGTASLTSSFPQTATQRGLNLGLVLSINPAIEALLDKGSAQANRGLYNQLESSKPSPGVQKPSTAAEVSGSGSGTFFINPSSSVKQSSSLGRSSQTLSISSRPAGNMERSLVGSVAKTQHMYTAQEEAHMLESNAGWRIGFMAHLPASALQTVIFEVLKDYKMQWKTVSPFHILARTIPTQAQPTAESLIVIDIFIMRLHDRHEDGYVVDFGFARGNTMQASELVSKISSDLIARVG